MAVADALRMSSRRDLADLAQFEAELLSSEDERLRRIALAVLLAIAGVRGWTTEYRSRLEGYRQDPSPTVAGAAQFTFLPPADQP